MVFIQTSSQTYTLLCQLQSTSSLSKIFRKHQPAEPLVELMVGLLPTLHSLQESVRGIWAHDVPD